MIPKVPKLNSAEYARQIRGGEAGARTAGGALRGVGAAAAGVRREAPRQPARRTGLAAAGQYDGAAARGLSGTSRRPANVPRPDRHDGNDFILSKTAGDYLIENLIEKNYLHLGSQSPTLATEFFGLFQQTFAGCATQMRKAEAVRPLKSMH